MSGEGVWAGADGGMGNGVAYMMTKRNSQAGYKAKRF